MPAFHAGDLKGVTTTGLHLQTNIAKSPIKLRGSNHKCFDFLQE